jgi:hypothetical protein
MSLILPIVARSVNYANQVQSSRTMRSSIATLPVEEVWTFVYGAALNATNCMIHWPDEIGAAAL